MEVQWLQTGYGQLRLRTRRRASSKAGWVGMECRPGRGAPATKYEGSVLTERSKLYSDFLANAVPDEATLRCTFFNAGYVSRYLGSSMHKNSSVLSSCGRFSRKRSTASTPYWSTFWCPAWLWGGGGGSMTTYLITFFWRFPVTTAPGGCPDM